MLTGMFRFVSVSTRVLAPRASSACLHSLNVPTQSTGGAVVVGFVLDRPGVGAGSHLSRHPHDADHHHAELGAHARNAGRVVHEGN